MVNGSRPDRPANKRARRRNVLGGPQLNVGAEAKSSVKPDARRKGKRPPATPAARDKWRATNTAREALVALAGVDQNGFPDISTLDWTRFTSASATTPKRIVQFWDREPPDQIRVLLDQVSSMCAQTGYEHVVYDLATARERIAQSAGEEWVRHYDQSFHASMQADIFRVLELYHHGGIYIDADMTLARAVPFPPPPVPLFVQWSHGPRTNVANWFLCSPPQQPIYDLILRRMNSKLRECERGADGTFKKTNLLGLTGPLVVSRSLERYLMRKADAADVAVMPVNWCHSFVPPARRFLSEKVEYKRAGLHWKREASED